MRVLQFFEIGETIRLKLSIENAKVAELADAPDLGSGTERCGGSSPPFRTNKKLGQTKLGIDKK
jgi:hypothetical protein